MAPHYDVLPQAMASMGVSFCAVSVGGWLSFPSIAIPKMIKETESYNQTYELDQSPLMVDLHVGSWIVSLFFIGTIFGSVAGGALNHHLGPKRVFQLCAPIAALTWVMIALSHHIWVIYMARIISGFLFGTFQANGKVYNAEIAHPDMKGSLGTMVSNFVGIGALYTFLLGYFVSSWRLISWMMMIPSIILGINVCFVPDSPYWLVERGREDEARKSLQILRGAKHDVETEFQEILQKKKSKDPDQHLSSILFSKAFFGPFIRIGSLMMIIQWAGINVVASYMVNIFQDAEVSIEPEVAPILVCIVQVFLSMMSTFILKVSPRKPLFMGCVFFIFLGQITLGTHSYLTKELSKEDSTPHGWIPVLAVTLVQSSRTVGFMTVIQLLIAESFPTEIRHTIYFSNNYKKNYLFRSYSSGICGSLTAINQFGSTKLYPVFLDEIGFPATFWLYGGVMVGLIIYGAFSIPENKGQSLVKTEDKMIGNSGNQKTQSQSTHLTHVSQIQNQYRNIAFDDETRMVISCSSRNKMF